MKKAKLIESRIFKTIEKHKLIENGDKIYVALSGGKDSTTALFTMKKYIEEKGIDCKLKAFHISFDLPNSKIVEKFVEKQSKLAKVKLEIVHVRDYGIDMEKIAKSKRPICSSCGIIKRYLINKFPREKGANKVATGHNMDDFLVFFFKNFLNKKFEWISKFKPKLVSEHPKQLTRIRPLFYVGGKECEIYCKENGIEYLKERICPLTYFSLEYDPKRKKWYEILYQIEKFQKDFRYRMAKAIASASKFFKSEESEIRECKICGEPTSQEICGFCKLVKISKVKSHENIGNRGFTRDKA